MTWYYNYQEWRKACTKLCYTVGGAYSIVGLKNARHRYAYDERNEIVGEFIHDKRHSRGYLNEKRGM